MKVTRCDIQVNENGEEEGIHGTRDFPMEAYEENIQETPVVWHWHEDLEILWVAEGKLVVHTNHGVSTLQQGEGIFINAGVLHAVDTAQNGTGILQSIVFQPELVGKKDSIYWKKYVQPLIEDESRVGTVYFLMSEENVEAAKEEIIWG